jgi:hypothetical protein
MTHTPAPVRRLAALLPFVLAASLFSAPAARGEYFAVAEHGYSVDLPEGWQPESAEDPAKLAFGDPTGTSFLQLTVVANEPQMSADEMEAEIHRQMDAEGQAGSFRYSGRDACLGEVAFTSGGKAFRGFVLVVKELAAAGAGGEDCVIITFSPSEKYAATRDVLLSALDSFSAGQNGLLEPGPISQISSPFPARSRQAIPVVFRGQTLSVEVGRGDREASQQLVEREARILASYKAGQVEAWTRYYRMIYRDSYRRLDGLSSRLAAAMSAGGVPPKDAPVVLLSWVQGFTYQRTGTLSDFLSPISCVSTAAGDCDSRAILYDMVLDHMGIDAIILVSTKYSHALAGVRVDRPGAAFAFKGAKYLVAETTADVAIGMIAKDMADGSAWIPMSLKEGR